MIIIKKKAVPQIAQKKNTRVYYEKLGKKLEFNEKIYIREARLRLYSLLLNESMVLLLEVKALSPRREILCRLITYNLDREVKLFSLLIIGFQQSRKSKYLKTQET